LADRIFTTDEEIELVIALKLKVMVFAIEGAVPEDIEEDYYCGEVLFLDLEEDLFVLEDDIEGELEFPRSCYEIVILEREDADEIDQTKLS